MHFFIIGGSDAGIAAGLRAHELDPSCEITLVLADEYPNYSICGLPFYLSGETPDWRSLAHRTEFPGIRIMPNHTAESIDAAWKSVIARNGGGSLIEHRLRSRLYEHFHPLGGICRIYLSSSSSTLAPKEQFLLMEPHLRSM